MQDTDLKVRVKKIKLLVIDLDGTLTDGMFYVSSRGDIMKPFYTRDFVAIEKVLKHIKVWILSQSIDNCIVEKVSQLSYGRHKNLYLSINVRDKKQFIEEEFIEEAILDRRDTIWDEIAYIGDADNDLECIKKAAIVGCPGDAITSVKNSVHYVTPSNGGKGSVSDFIDYLFELGLGGNNNEPV
jgi:3-deoxy-D-manno-octulosonate 8-phosphate phosphatase (KDO 8-P phosphatase)